MEQFSLERSEESHEKDHDSQKHKLQERCETVFFLEEESEIITASMSNKGCCKEKGDKLTALTAVSIVEEAIHIAHQKISLIKWLREQ